MWGTLQATLRLPCHENLTAAFGRPDIEVHHRAGNLHMLVFNGLLVLPDEGNDEAETFPW